MKNNRIKCDSNKVGVYREECNFNCKHFRQCRKETNKIKAEIAHDCDNNINDGAFFFWFRF